MSAQLRPEGAPSFRAVPAQPVRHPPDPGEAAFERWLKGELGKLYDAALAEPVPEELRRLLEPVPANDQKARDR